MQTKEQTTHQTTRVTADVPVLPFETSLSAFWDKHERPKLEAKWEAALRGECESIIVSVETER